jgi:uncharacterized membrane protein
MVELLLYSCAVAGGYISLYFTLVYYKIIQPDIRWVPSFCRVKDQTCARILEAPSARTLGLPNSVFGLAYYGAILILPSNQFEILFLVASIFSVGLGMYLTHTLIVKLHVHCTLCFTAHLINLVIANLFILRAMQLA